MDTLFLARPDQLAYLGEYDHPKEAFVALECHSCHQEVRAQIYAAVMGLFFDEARELEIYIDAYQDDGPGVWQLSEDLVILLAEADEDEIIALAEMLPDFGLVSEAGLETEDLLDFLFPLAGLARNCLDEDDLKLYVMIR